MPFVEYGIELVTRVRVSVEVTHHNVLYIIHVTGVILRPYQPAVGRRHTLQRVNPRLAQTDSLARMVFHETALQVVVLHKHVSDKAPIVPTVQPVLYLFILYPVLHPFVLLHVERVEHWPLSVYQSQLAVKDARCQVILLQYPADVLGQVVVRTPWHYTHSCYRHGVHVPTRRVKAQEPLEGIIQTSLHPHGIGAHFSRHKMKVSNFSCLTHNYRLMYIRDAFKYKSPQ